MSEEDEWPTEPQTFDWQMDGGNDKSWGGKARSWIHDKPGRTRSLSACKTLAVWLPPSDAEVSSAGSADLTTGSPEQGSSMCSCASPTPGGGTCCEHGSPGCRCTTTCALWEWNELGQWEGRNIDLHPDAPEKFPWTCRCTTTYAESLPENQRGELLLTEVAHQITTGGGKPGQGYQAVLISSAAGSRARTCPSPDDAPGSLVNDPDCSTSSPASLSLFDPDGYSSRTYPGSSPRTAVGTSESLLERWPTSGTAWAGGFSTAVSSECRSDDEGCSSSEPSLGTILEPPQNVPARYSLSARAARGILRRAEKRGRTLPGHLAAALEAVAGLRTPNE